MPVPPAVAQLLLLATDDAEPGGAVLVTQDVHMTMFAR